MKTKREPRSAWPEEVHHECGRLIAKGLNSAQIATELNFKFGLSLTRNAVNGHRWRHFPTDRKINEGRIAKGYAPFRPKIARAKVSAAPLPPANDSNEKKVEARRLKPTCGIAELGTNICHYPIGDTRGPGFGYCGRGCEGTYCPAHRLLMYDLERTARLRKNLTPPYEARVGRRRAA